MRLLRQPLLHFLLIGGVLFLVQRSGLVAPDVPARAAGAESIVVDAAQLARLRAEGLRETGRAPDAAELRARVARWVDDEMLVREALRLRLTRSDPVVRERLIRNMRFVDPQRRASNEALLAEAEALGMPRSDLVVRRRLVQVMERRLVRTVRVDDAALSDYLQRHAGRYAPATHLDFRHIFLRDDGSHADPRGALSGMLAQLADGAEPPQPGDSFLLGARLQGWSDAEVRQRFGGAFADALLAAPARSWIGPLRSPYGWHLVRVESRAAGRAADLDALRPRLMAALLEERRRDALAAALQQLRRRYAVEVAAAINGGTA